MSNVYDMDQIRNSVNARSLPRSNAMYGSSTLSNEQGSLHRRLDVVKNKQGFPHLRERVQVKKLVHGSMIRFGTWNKKVPLKLKGKFYRTAVRPTMLYGTEMRMLRWMSGKTRQDSIRNDNIRERVGVALIFFLKNLGKNLNIFFVLEKNVIPILNVSRKFSMCIIFSTGYIKIYNINSTNE